MKIVIPGQSSKDDFALESFDVENEDDSEFITSMIEAYKEFGGTDDLAAEADDDLSLNEIYLSDVARYNAELDQIDNEITSLQFGQDIAQMTAEKILADNVSEDDDIEELSLIESEETMSALLYATEADGGDSEDKKDNFIMRMFKAIGAFFKKIGQAVSSFFIKIIPALGKKAEANDKVVNSKDFGTMKDEAIKNAAKLKDKLAGSIAAFSKDPINHLKNGAGITAKAAVAVGKVLGENVKAVKDTTAANVKKLDEALRAKGPITKINNSIKTAKNNLKKDIGILGDKFKIRFHGIYKEYFRKNFIGKNGIDRRWETMWKNIKRSVTGEPTAGDFVRGIFANVNDITSAGFQGLKASLGNASGVFKNIVRSADDARKSFMRDFSRFQHSSADRTVKANIRSFFTDVAHTLSNVRSGASVISDMMRTSVSSWFRKSSFIGKIRSAVQSVKNNTNK